MTAPGTQIRCPHCGERLLRWRNPQLACWDGDYQYVCFNDDCPYFVRGWEWMRTQFNVTASYRHRFDPKTGDTGPLPVWSREALKCNLAPEKETSDDRD